MKVGDKAKFGLWTGTLVGLINKAGSRELDFFVFEFERWGRTISIPAFAYELELLSSNAGEIVL
jgi:hypothetical protein